MVAGVVGPVHTRIEHLGVLVLFALVELECERAVFAVHQQRHSRRIRRFFFILQRTDLHMQDIVTNRTKMHFVVVGVDLLVLMQMKVARYYESLFFFLYYKRVPGFSCFRSSAHL